LESHPECSVVALDCLTYAGNLKNLKSVEDRKNYTFVKADIGDKETVCALLKNHEIDVIVHFAAESHVDRSIEDPAIFLKTNVLGTFNLLKCARECWGGGEKETHGKQFIHVSTDEVYGSLGPTGFFTEETPYRPNSPYSASKAASDHIARGYFHTYEFPGIITNCSNNYGPFQFPEKLIPLMWNNILNKKPLPVYGKGQNIRDWLYVRDYCRALHTVMEKGKPGGQYNIGGNNEWRNIDIVRLICSIVDKKLGRSGGERSEELITFVKDRPGHDMRYAIDAGKIRKELGWAPEETFETGIEKTIDWYLNNQEWLKNVTSGKYQEYYEQMYGDR
jgi:dTDP-glucose 4,6-dehydratase